MSRSRERASVIIVLMQERAKRQRVKLGDVVAIPLPVGSFAFGRVLRDAGIGVFAFRSDRSDVLPLSDASYDFVVGVYADVLTDGGWPKVGHMPFGDPEDEWPPPQSVTDPITTGRFQLYHKGEIRPASADQIKGLEPAAVWDRQHIVDRILGKPGAAELPRPGVGRN